MSYNIGIDEMNAPSAPCRELRAKLVKVHVEDTSGLEDILEYDSVVDLGKAQEAVGDWDAFLKRNRINTEADAVYMDKVKKEDDRKLLEPLAERICTGWIIMEELSEEDRERALSRAGPDDRLTGWDELSFDEMNDMCANCPLSWDKGRGCIGAFGPDSTQLPEIAGRHGCDLVASVPELAKGCTILAPSDAEKLLKECATLADILPEEGKMAVRRYAGPVERMRLVAEISVKEGCGFYFF